MTRRFTRPQIAELLDIEEGFVLELQRHEIIVADVEARFDARALERVRVCWTLHKSLGVNLEGIDVALNLLDRWEEERRRLLALIEELRRERDG